MQFYSGFALQDEEYLFDDFLHSSEYTISGFSYGAIKAFHSAQKMLNMGKRVDKLQLLSPAFFQTKNDKFKRLQMLAYSKNRPEYMRQFIDTCFYPYEKKIVKLKKSSNSELDELLNYRWNLGELQKLLDASIKIEVYLGEKDNIIDIDAAREFFLQIATVTYIKDANHFLQIN
ncbi:MAG: pimelyl-ACP methyl ester esterase BioV [Campylobacterota bacterium]|nr:pimelyl-ACP methyl ester esterase BioV [Campylobacterota bacterium]